MTIKLPGVVTAIAAYTLERAASVVSQVLTAATAAVIVGSIVAIPDSGLKVGSIYKMKLAISKDANGSATSSYVVGVVASGVDPTVVANVVTLLTFTKPAGTAAADEGVIEITLCCVKVSTAAEGGSIIGEFVMTHNLASTGHAATPCVAISVADTSTATILTAYAGGYMVVVATTGAADVSNVHYATAELVTPAAA